MKNERKNKENLGQEIFFGNFFRKIKNITRLTYIFILAFLFLFILFLSQDLTRDLFIRQMKCAFDYIRMHLNFFQSLETNKSTELEILVSNHTLFLNMMKAIFIASILTFMAQIGFMKIGRKSAQQEVLDGANELDIQLLNQQIFSWLKKWLRREEEELGQKKFNFLEWNDIGYLPEIERKKIFYGEYLNFGNKEKLYIPEELLKTHIGVEGASGTGKTVLINSICDQIRNHKSTQVCILDYNGQYYTKFGRKSDVVLSIDHKNGVKWHPWLEKIQPEKIAESLIEEDPKDTFFAPAARGLFSDLISINNNIEGFWHDLTLPKEEIHEKLSRYKFTSADDFASKSGAQGAGVRRTMTLKLNALRTLNYWTKNSEEFSIIDWAKNGSNRWIFIIVREEDRETAKPWLRLWMDLVVSGILMRDEKADNNATWLIGDEIPMLGKLPSLENGITNGRKYNFRSVIGFQTEGQIDETYGKFARGIKNSTRTRFIFNPGDPDSAYKCAATLGKKEIYDPLESETFGDSQTRNAMVSNNQIREKFVIHPDKLRLLDKTECYLRLPFFNPIHMRIPLKHYPIVNKSHECEHPPRILELLQNPLLD